MAITVTTNSKSNLKKSTNNDLPFAPAQPVANSYIGVSTAGQTLIANLGFSVDTTNPANFQLYIDGRLQTLGSANDYTFAAIAADGTSSAINLNTSLPVNLNINAIKLGLKKESEFLTDNRFTQLYEAEGQGFQAFVNTANVLNATSTAGTPVAGTFYSTITGRAALVDFSQDLKPRMGIDRIPVQQIVQLQTEFGPNGEPVFSAVNDNLGQIRFVGSGWVSYNESNGARTQTSNAGDFLEITFYGTGLNILSYASSAFVTAVTVDGNTATAPSVSGSGILLARNYSGNQIINFLSGLALGIHTVKISYSSGGNLPVAGFEILNPSANVITNPGVSYLSGKKQILAAQSTIAYNAAVTGTTGGRMLMYQTAAGAVAQAFQANASAASYLTAVSHTNEEIVRTYHFREFGAGRGDDFSLTQTANTNLAFTLDDGTTTLIASTVAIDPAQNAVFLGLAGSFISFTFVGTGVDFVEANGTGGAVTSQWTLFVDGISISTGNTGQLPNKRYALVSGLPYGTHTIRIAQTTSAINVGITKFIVYQPKTPSLPSGAVSLGAYNVMANYVANTVAGSQNTVATGVLRKLALRESVYVGTWTIPAIDPGFNCGFNFQTSVAGSYAEYAFFGTGIEFRTYIPNTTNNFTISIDGSSNLSAYTTSYISSGGTATFTPSTGTLSGIGAAQYGQGINISGLPLGLHKIRITQNTTNIINVDAFDIITPIHSQKSNVTFDLQNTLTVGSQGIQDNRVFTPIKDAGLQVKNISQAFGVAQNPTTTSTSAVPMPDMSVTHKNTTGRIKISYSYCGGNNTVNALTFGAIYFDGQSNIGKYFQAYAPGANGSFSDVLEMQVSPGVHKIDIYWAVNTGTANAGARNMLVEEI